MLQSVQLPIDRVERPVNGDMGGRGLDAIQETADGGLWLGALVSNADTADHPLVKARYPMLSAAILACASPQVRNRASNGGNLLQRTRCYYFYDAKLPCNKRIPGSGCPAIGGLARQHAILGTSDHCIATHASDMCVALAALDAIVHVVSPAGSRAISFGDFHRLPGDAPQLDTTLAHDEAIAAIELPPSAFQRHSTYLTVRDHASYTFALVSVAAALDVDSDGTVRAARIALGGVAHKPWRDRQAEALLVGRCADRPAFTRAADRLLRDARCQHGQTGNGFKIPMARHAVVRALEMAMAGSVGNTGQDAHRIWEHL